MKDPIKRPKARGVRGPKNNSNNPFLRHLSFVSYWNTDTRVYNTHNPATCPYCQRYNHFDYSEWPGY